MSPYGDMKPSPTEFIILKHLWQAGPQSQSEIHNGVVDQLEWSRSSTRKTIERMFDKKMLSIAESHGTRIYKPTLKKIPTIAAMIQNFASSVLGLEGPLPVSNLVKSQVLSPSELEALDVYLKHAVATSEGHNSKDRNNEKNSKKATTS